MRQHNLIKKIVFSVLTATALLLVPLTAAAQYGGTPTTGTTGGLQDLGANPGVNQTNIQVNDRQGVLRVMATVINWALYLAGAIAVIFVILGGYRYVTSAGNEEAATKGRKTIVNALIGLVFIILAYVIVNAVANFLIS